MGDKPLPLVTLTAYAGVELYTNHAISGVEGQVGSAVTQLVERKALHTRPIHSNCMQCHLLTWCTTSVLRMTRPLMTGVRGDQLLRSTIIHHVQDDIIYCEGLDCYLLLWCRRACANSTTQLAMRCMLLPVAASCTTALSAQDSTASHERFAL